MANPRSAAKGFLPAKFAKQIQPTPSSSRPPQAANYDQTTKYDHQHNRDISPSLITIAIGKERRDTFRVGRLYPIRNLVMYPGEVVLISEPHTLCGLRAAEEYQDRRPSKTRRTARRSSWRGRNRPLVSRLVPPSMAIPTPTAMSRAKPMYCSAPAMPKLPRGRTRK